MHADTALLITCTVSTLSIVVYKVARTTYKYYLRRKSLHIPRLSVSGTDSKDVAVTINEDTTGSDKTTSTGHRHHHHQKANVTSSYAQTESSDIDSSKSKHRIPSMSSGTFVDDRVDPSFLQFVATNFSSGTIDDQKHLMQGLKRHRQSLDIMGLKASSSGHQANKSNKTNSGTLVGTSETVSETSAKTRALKNIISMMPSIKSDENIRNSLDEKIKQSVIEPIRSSIELTVDSNNVIRKEFVNLTDHHQHKHKSFDGTHSYAKPRSLEKSVSISTIHNESPLFTTYNMATHKM